MTKNEGNLTSYSNMSNNITIGSGHNILVIDCENALVPNPNHYLTLNNALHAPKLIKNLVYVWKFTIDNDISIEFDPSYFFVKDFQA